jgi:hypothetical protein
MMSEQSIGQRVSVVVSPRQRWSLAVRSLRSVVERMPAGSQLIYVDGGAPDGISAELHDIVSEHHGEWIRRDCLLAGNEARNLAMPFVEREFIVFIDNDVIPEPEWVERLVECADETDAAVVGPVILHGRNDETKQIHIAGGRVSIVDGVMVENDHFHAYQNIDEVGPSLERSPSNQLEFHSILLRTSFARDFAPFDEELLTLGDHEDVTLGAEARGLGVWLEPASQVTYLTMLRLEDYEVGYWQLRWCEDWNRRSLERFAEKWAISMDAGWPVDARLWATRERIRWYHGRSRLHSTAGKAIRAANKFTPTAKLTRGLEERVMSRQKDAEVARRVAAGIDS